ncbi:DNA-binding CsgD family transcriptional regulator/tetratricopeptide (TPR) repeat protein [Thermocatellispora tengchongensis]|uniref:DNA-binding CsgD family transcriptional regulator/tetratricopeptide (TPR) repeat protein n=1 Tax=Thermocatellispora tengchongensis TaxID=1073253 RepID=A0A840PCW0_9ACTN|nr:LuxR family transcriptional regulator [Thermocatellispora tengchongensis]MBB5135260.1 DNA-binding CsgD family transcriptional regulator/tetratricopeptide (TPR) repeat protein [Thermocatellispora tengchongensis]
MSHERHGGARACHGREAERALLRDLIAGARESGGALLLLGAPGLGKTTMLDYAAAHAACDPGEGGFTVLRASGAESEHLLPFSGLHALLRPVTDRLAALPWAQAAALTQALETGTATGGLVLHAAVLNLLLATARERPVLACVDDVHLLDPASREALFFAARRLRGEPVLLLFAGSDGAGLRGVGLPAIPERTLRPLDAEASRALLDGLLPEGVPEDVRAAVLDAGCGNPLALIELAGALTPAQLWGSAPPPETLPPGGRLWRAHARRLARLPEATRAVLLMVAADPHLETDTLMRAVEPEHALAALEPAEAEGIVEVRGREVGFREPLVRSIVYQEASLARRRAAHRTLARLLDHDHHRLRQAWHRAAALDGPREELAGELHRAASEARGQGGYVESSLAFERAAELTARRADKAARLAAAAYDAWLAGQPGRTRILLARLHPLTTSPELRVRAELIRGHLELRGGEPAHARDELLAAAEWLLDRDRALAVRALMRAGEASYLAGDHERYLAIARHATALRRPDDPAATQLMFEYLDGLAATFSGRHDQATGPLRRVLELSSSVANPSVLVWASVASLLLGEDEHALALSSRAVDTARARRAAAAVPHALEFLVHAESWLGRYASVAANALEGYRRAEETGQRNSAAQHLAWLALSAAVQGDAETCRIRSRAAIELADAHGLGLTSALSNWALAVLDLSSGNTAAAADRLRATAGSGGGGHVVVRVIATPHFVEAAVRTGDRERARAALAVLDRWVSSTASPDRLALAARCHALLAPPREADDRFRHALELHRAGSSEFELARTQLLYGSALRRSRRPGAAREHLHGALQTFERFDARLWAEQARGELRASGEAVQPREASRPARELTAQQLQIARMVAEGATNREVAAQLFLSVRTVEHHLRNIFARLDVRSRVELARLFS